jgi:hypothetical protein
MEGMTCIKMGMILVGCVLRKATTSVSSALFSPSKEHGGGVVGMVCALRMIKALRSSWRVLRCNLNSNKVFELFVPPSSLALLTKTYCLPSPCESPSTSLKEVWNPQPRSLRCICCVYQTLLLVSSGIGPILTQHVELAPMLSVTTSRVMVFDHSLHASDYGRL